MNLTDAKQEAELGHGSLYITLQRKFNKNLLAKYKQWICDSRTSEDVNALGEFFDHESEFMTAASETIAGVLKDGKREREPSQLRKIIVPRKNLPGSAPWFVKV